MSQQSITTDDQLLIASALNTLHLEAQAIQNLSKKINHHFVRACRLILSCQGHIIITGMGKSGHIARKIAATFSSTGTPAFYVHPGEACHGDLGMMTGNDVVLAISNSGETSEILTLLPLLKRIGLPIISMVGKESSSLANQSDVVLTTQIDREACPFNLAPTSSTAVQLALGDALAVSLLNARGFTEEDFAFSHPGGTLGKKLILKIKDIMRTGTAIPKVTVGSSLQEALFEMTQKGMGMTAVINNKDQLEGIFTDGDLRKALTKKYDITQVTVDQVMTSACITIAYDKLAAKAIDIMKKNKISGLLCVNEEKQLMGAISMHDLLKEGIA